MAKFNSDWGCVGKFMAIFVFSFDGAGFSSDNDQ